MEILRIDHIHFKTNNSDKVVPLFTKLLGKEPTTVADFSENHGMKDTIWAYPDGFQVTQVINPNIAEGKVYADVPDGIFGFALHVRDVEAAGAEIEEIGGKLLYENDFVVVKEKVYQIPELGGLIIEVNQFEDDIVTNTEKNKDITDFVTKNAKEHS